MVSPKPDTRKAAPAPPHKPCFLAGWRILAGLSQEELGAAVGYAKSTVSAIETGQRPWSQPFLENVVEYLRTQGLPGLTIGDVIEVDPANPDQIEIWQLSRRVPENKQEAAAGMLRGLTERRQDDFSVRAQARPIRRRKGR